MKLETAVQIWLEEAKAHNYHGFLVIDDPIDRVFFRNDEYNAILENFEDNDTVIIQEVWV